MGLLSSDLKPGLVVTAVLCIFRNWCSAHLLRDTLLFYFPAFHLQISLVVGVGGGLAS